MYIYQRNITSIEVKDHWQKTQDKDKRKKSKLHIIEFCSIPFDIGMILDDEQLIILRDQIQKRINAE